MRKLQILLTTLTVVGVVLALSFGVTAQESETPTPAPSKTPSLDADTDSEDMGDPISVAELPPLPRSFTQEDLSVLVGNVQRPNGIVWFEDQLYTACNGDWTLYRIDSRNAQTITFVNGVQDAHQLHAEATETGFNLWIPDADTNRLIRLDQSRFAPTVIASEGLDTPWGIVELDEEHFLISNLRSGNIVIANREGEIQLAVEGLRNPAGLARHDDVIYVANNGSARRAIEWFDVSDLDDEGPVEGITQPLVSGLQNVSNVVIAEDGYLYFSYALGSRGVVGRINPTQCYEDGCSNDDVEIVVFTELPAPLAGLTISSDMRLFVHTIYRPEIYWVQLPQVDA